MPSPASFWRETGLDKKIDDARFLGVYEHFYATNRFHDPSFTTHYVVLAHELTLSERPQIATDDQHSAIRWMTPEEILSADNVHGNTKAYFR
ncbi:MAG: NUDIX domain-containing protein [Methylovirgula sp.]